MTRALFTMLLLAHALLALPAGCAYLQAAGKAAEQVAIDCGEEAVASQAAAIVEGVMAHLAGGKDSMASDLEAIGKQAGRAALQCSVQQAQKRFLQKAAVAEQSAALSSLGHHAAAARAAGFAARKAFVYRGLH